MAVFKWILMMSACSVIVLLVDRSVMAAPLYDSNENQKSDVTENIPEEITDYSDSSTESSGDETKAEDKSEGSADFSNSNNGSTESDISDASLPDNSGETGHTESGESGGDGTKAEDKSEGSADFSNSNNGSSESEINDASLPDNSGETGHNESGESGGDETKAEDKSEGSADSSDSNNGSSESDINDAASLPDNSGETGHNESGSQSKADARHSAPSHNNPEEDLVPYHGEVNKSQSGTELVPGSGNNTNSSGTQVQKVIAKQGQEDDDGINEPGLGSSGKESGSSGAIGSYIVLGIILAVIVVLVGYSVFKRSGRRQWDAKSEDFGAEMSEVKKNLLPGNKLKAEIQPNTHLEEDESNAKLLSDAPLSGDSVQNGGTGTAVQSAGDTQQQLGGSDDLHTKEKNDFDGIETVLIPKNSADNTLNAQNQRSTNPFKETASPKKQETSDGQNTLHQSSKEPTNSPGNMLNAQNQKSSNPFKETATPKKQETSSDQSTQQQSLRTPSDQKAYNNVNGFPDVIVEKAPDSAHSEYANWSSGVPGTIQGGMQQHVGTLSSSVSPVQVVTVVEQGCSPMIPVIVNVERSYSVTYEGC